jgi:Aspartyl/asparaginyl-tRNA synthetases
MKRTYINDLKTKIGQQVTLKGWLQTLRDQKSMQFLILRDKTGLVQIAHWKKRQS